MRFWQTFLATAGALEVWGLPTSRPAYDPSNHSFVYQRFERGIMHYDTACGCTQGLLLGDLFKVLLTGQNLPLDLEQRARGSPYYRQYDPSSLNAVARPEDLPVVQVVLPPTGSWTNLAWAFLPPANASELRPATR